jgi:hypothetical protein
MLTGITKVREMYQLFHLHTFDVHLLAHRESGSVPSIFSLLLEI